MNGSRRCQQCLHPSWVWSILSIIKVSRTWLSWSNWICLFVFFFFMKLNLNIPLARDWQKLLVNLAVLAWGTQLETIQGFSVFYENQTPFKEMHSDSLSSIISSENLALCIFPFQASRLSSSSREIQAWISLKHFNYFPVWLSLEYLWIYLVISAL